VFSIAKWIQAGTTAVLLGGCAGASVRVPGAAPPRGNVPPMPGPARSGGGGTSRTICRTSSAPAGYVITDFVSSAACESTAGQTYNAMLVEDVSRSQVGTVVRICVNQRIPRDWNLTRADVGATGQCPREPTDKATSPTVIEIVRNREGG
jgi:hypothetical protein